ncbi:BREX system P-loop protein BrxC [Desulfobotulus mexicanus]|uniref:BREX system P-loop protein BrxC n=1 Tax=Desulfobotulus mexicanus TaxID=2586642 RepID=A0A5Q4VD20_9BACT|nr:BREX system P-loop protein BrxC [Desulfobotulus mexicanus]TYT75599.1 BREX system P-loop protein BrxC [Desulfobotulus mexicanus]
MKTLKSIFKKPVDRSIEGVIKADDESELRIEFDEYVLTGEAEKRIESFLAAYNNYEGANGVWISGFFGSGKSHLLKILAYVLENREIDGETALNFFLPKCADNKILSGDLKRAVQIPSKSILFNIDQKADVISKTQMDALLAVFVKVFDESCGYYGKHGHIAQFERDLDSRGLLEAFQSAYAQTAGKPWQRGREQALLESKNIAEAYAAATGGDKSEAAGILDKYRSQYRVSIEDFAEKVNDWIERQVPGFRLNFFVDEVGQYIANNTKLMTNLQTIAESLATRCRGRSWVIVTAQEDMSRVIGEMDRHKGNDFTKIQARFSNRMKLTSADVAEVIQKRLLKKNEEGVALLSDLYKNQSNNFKTLFDFTDGSVHYRNFTDEEHFIDTYPFVPYQFALFQSAIQNLSIHNAFEGKHSSVGERSMLAVFQQVAIHIGNHLPGELATFDLMFEGIRTALKARIQQPVQQAEIHLGHPFGVRILKALFLVKYVKEFKPSIRNLSVLMLKGFDQDLSSLKKEIEEALNLLEQQTYIQRNGDLYAYLTDEEKDIEEEIKNTEIETSEIASELKKIIFDQIVRLRKIPLDSNGQHFIFSRKLDDRLYDREQELSIHVISPFHEHAENLEMIRIKSNYDMDELFVLMPADARLMQDLMMLKKTEKYVRQNTTAAQQDSVKRILDQKISQNQERGREIESRIQELLGKARLLVAGKELDLKSGEAQARIKAGFQELVALSYPNLKILKGLSYNEDDISSHLHRNKDALFGTDAAPMSEAEQEVLSFITSNKKAAIRNTVKGVLERFEKKPYGWPYPAILSNLASLMVRGKVEIRYDTNLLEEKAYEKMLRNTQAHPRLVLEPQVEFAASQVRKLKEFYEEFFNQPAASTEAKALARDTDAALQKLKQLMEKLLSQSSRYPFLNALAPAVETLKECSEKPYDWYLTELGRHEDRLYDLKEDLIDPVIRFMEGSQREIFDQAMDFMAEQKDNFACIQREGDSAFELKESGHAYISPEVLQKALNDPRCFKGNGMQQIKAHVGALEREIKKRIEAEILSAKKNIEELKTRICTMEEFLKLNENQKDEIIKSFDESIKGIEKQKLIPVIRDSLRHFEDTKYQRLLSRITLWAQPVPLSKPSLEPEPDPLSGDRPKAAFEKKPEPVIEYVPSRNVRVAFDKAWLADEKDVERYIHSMKNALLEEIRKGKRIQI